MPNTTGSTPTGGILCGICGAPLSLGQIHTCGGSASLRNLPTSPTTDELWDAIYRESRLRDEMGDAILRALGHDPNVADTWPCDDFVFDPYDNSFELIGCDPAWVPDIQPVLALGFSHGWLRYTDGTERTASSSLFGKGLSKPHPMDYPARERHDGEIARAARDLRTTVAALTAENERLTRLNAELCDALDPVGRIERALEAEGAAPDQAEGPQPDDIAELRALADKFERETQVFLGYRNAERAELLRHTADELARLRAREIL